MKYFFWAFISFLMASSCTSEVNEDKGAVLVQAYNNVLYDKDIDDLLTGDESPEDSALIINAYIERWLRNQVMLYEAENRIEDMSRINELTEDYRRSLILYDYEEQLTTAMLDTAVSQKEVIDYYEEHEKDFVLNQPVVGLLWWKNGDMNEEDLNVSFLRDSLRKMGFDLQGRDSMGQLDYFSYRDIMRKFPDVNLKDLPDKVFSVNRNDIEWRILILEEVPEGEIAPLSFVSDEIEKLILHRRKIKLLQKIKEENYQKALKKNRIKYFN
jgi:hypothetical protein